MRRNELILISSLIILVGFGCQRATPEQKSSSPEIDREQILFEARKSGLIMDEKEIAQMADPAALQTVPGTSPTNPAAAVKADTTGWKSAALADVTGGGSFGLAFATRQKEKTTVITKMGNLPALEEGQSYEGWLVQRGETMKVVSLGKASIVGDQYVIVFETQIDLSDYDFFVLTQAQTHILEGSFR